MNFNALWVFNRINILFHFNYLQLITDVPCTFSSLESYILVQVQQGGVVRAKFQFRTHDEDGLILYHSMNDPSEVRVGKTHSINHSMGNKLV